MKLLSNPSRVQADLAGTRLSYSEAGEGPAVVCLHSGLPGASGEIDFVANLDSLANRHRVILVDLPSFGDSAAISTPDPAAFAGRLIGELIAHLEIEVASLIGNGLGGEVALHLAAAAPEKVHRVVLLAPSGCRYSAFTPVPMEGMKAIQQYWRSPSRERMAAVLRLLSTDAKLNGDGEIDRRQAEALSDPERVEIHRKATAELRDVLPLAPSITSPTLLIWGREDRFVPIEHGLSLLTRIPDARFHLVPRCGHNAQREQAGEVNALLRDFLGSAP